MLNETSKDGNHLRASKIQSINVKDKNNQIHGNFAGATTTNTNGAAGTAVIVREFKKPDGCRLRHSSI